MEQHLLTLPQTLAQAGQLEKDKGWKKILTLKKTFIVHHSDQSYCFYHRQPPPPHHPSPHGLSLLLKSSSCLCNLLTFVTSQRVYMIGRVVCVSDLILRRLRWPCVTFWTSRCQKSPDHSCSWYLFWFVCRPHRAQCLWTFLQVGHSGLQSNQGFTFHILLESLLWSVSLTSFPVLAVFHGAHVFVDVKEKFSFIDFNNVWQPNIQILWGLNAIFKVPVYCVQIDLLRLG